MQYQYSGIFICLCLICCCTLDIKSSMESPAVRRKMEDDENRARRESLEGASAALNGSGGSCQ